MQTAYQFMSRPTIALEELLDDPQDKELIDWIYLHIRAIPSSIFRFEEYCNTVVGKINAVPESHFPLIFVLWCKVMCARLYVDNGYETKNYDTLNTILNSTSDILHHSCAHLIYEDRRFINQLHNFLQNICRQNKQHNSILATQIVGEIYICAREYNTCKKHFMTTIKEELIAKAWHPRRVMKLMDAGIEPEDM